MIVRQLSSLALVALLALPAAALAGKQTICHIPPGNPDNAHSITVAQAAVAAHLAHGDSLDECPESTTGGGGGVPAMAGSSVSVSICSNSGYGQGRGIGVSPLGRVQQDVTECGG
jgi:hypothetical protein